MAIANDEIIVRIKAQVSGFKKGMEAADKQLQSFTKVTKNLDKGSEKLGVRFKQSMQVFSGWAMSIMFAGMAIQRAFSGIISASFKTFQEVAHSIEGNVTEIDILAAKWEALKYASGVALEPIAAQMQPVIDAIREWIEENEELYASIVLWGTIIGSVLMIFGMVTLGVKGIITGIGHWITWIGQLKMALQTVNGVMFAKIALIILMGFWIYKLQKVMGGWGEFFKSVLRGILRLMVMFSQATFDFLIFPLLKFIDLINIAIGAFNKLTGKNIATVDLPEWMTNPSYFLEQYFEWETTGALAPDEGYTNGTNPFDVQLGGQPIFNFYGYNTDEINDTIESQVNNTNI